MNILNEFIVSGAANGEEIIILNPPRRRLSKEDALQFAAWIVVLTAATEDEFKKYLELVRNT